MIFIILLGLGVYYWTATAFDETLTAYAPANAQYRLIEINGDPFPALATLNLGENGQLTGQAPCNRWNTVQTAPYPWFEIGPINATRIACEELHNETLFFISLEGMTLAEVVDSILILSNLQGAEMVFFQIK